MWERYGFYVVQTLLALYLAIYFKWNDDRIYPLVGSFTALTYLSPMIGGWIADHLIGQKRTILTGIIVLFLSYLALGLLMSDEQLTWSLAGIAVGTGLLKPNISSLLGNEYRVGSPNRERGFTIFYMGITSGIILGTTLPSYLVNYFNWSTAFLSSTIGMIIAFVTFIFGIYYYRLEDYAVYQHKSLHLLYAIALILALWCGSYYILHNPILAQVLFAVIGLLSVYYLISTCRQESPTQAKQTLVIGLLCLISILFWSFYFQMFLSLTLFLQRIAEPTLFGMPFPPPYYVAVQSIGMIIFGLFLAKHYKPVTIAQQTVRIGNKFILSMLFMCLAYGLITLVCHWGTATLLLSPLLFIPAYLMISMAELLLSPVGLSAITVLSSPAKVSTMMGIFFVSLGLGGFLSGKLATLTALSQEALEKLPIPALKIHYAATFTHLLMILVAATCLCFILNLMIKKLARNF